MGTKMGTFEVQVFILEYAAKIFYCHLQMMLTTGWGMGNSVKKHMVGRYHQDL